MTPTLIPTRARFGAYRCASVQPTLASFLVSILGLDDQAKMVDSD
jgi:hypothetical protein